MTAERVTKETGRLIDAMTEHRDSVGLRNSAATAESSRELALWLQHLRGIAPSATASELLAGAQAAALEVTAYTSVGLGRAAIYSMRLQVDLLLSYLYFRFHSQEWDHLKRTGDGFMLPSALDAYFRANDKGLGARLSMLDTAGEPALLRVYRLLSAHVHAQSHLTVPRQGELPTLVMTEGVASSLSTMQERTVKALSNYMCALYAETWMNLPRDVVVRVNSALTPKQRALFFSLRPSS